MDEILSGTHYCRLGVI